MSPPAQNPGCMPCIPPYLQEVGDTPSRASVLVHCMDLEDAASGRCVLRDHSHREGSGARGTGKWWDQGTEGLKRWQ